MTTKEYRETEDFLPNTWVNRMFKGPFEFTYQLMIYAFVFGSLCHLWLADAWTGDWTFSNIVFLFGLGFLLVRSSIIGWLFCAIASAIPLLFHRDVLTQSVLLLAISSSGFLYQCVVVLKPELRQAYENRHLATVAWFGMIAYAFASLHKLNRDFFNPEYSCAIYGFDKLQSYYSFTLNGLDSSLAYLVVLVEISIPILYLFQKKYAARTVALLFHIPLTLTMAPAFVFVMAISHVAFFDEKDRVDFKSSFTRHWVAILIVAILTTSTSLAFHGSWPEWTMIPREFLLWFTLFWVIITWVRVWGNPLAAAALKLLFDPRSHAPRGNAPNDRHSHAEHGNEHINKFLGQALNDNTGFSSNPSFVLLFLFALNCFSPYLGVQYQHSSAMLSNLRIDKGCWNSSIFPESIRISDDYVRVQETYFVEPGRIQEYEKIVLEQLWSPPQIRQMRRNWCSKSIQPFFLKGRYKERDFVIEDLCNEKEIWPFEDDGIFGISLFEGALRFQKNLNKECPQACIH